MDPIETIGNTKGLLIVEKYRTAVQYLYPILVQISHKHRVLRDEVLSAVLVQMKLFEVAAKSTQISKLYEADAGLAYIRDLLSILADPTRKLLSLHQYETASIRIAEAGNMLGTWIKKKKVER